MALGYAILSLLERRDFSGYELMKTFDQSVAAFWHATHPQIYRELARLEQRALVSHRLVIQQARPNKKVFSITKPGRTELRRWLEEPEAPAPRVNDLTTLKAFSLPLLPPERAVAKIRELAAIHRPHYESYLLMERRMSPNVGRSYGTGLGDLLGLLRGLTYEEAYLRWCEWAERAISQAVGRRLETPARHARIKDRSPKRTRDALAL